MARAKRGSGQVVNPYAPMPAPGALHGACVEHITVEGLAHQVCVMRGQDRDQVLADVAELMALPQRPPNTRGPWPRVKGR